jgi:DNA repair protein RecN (Recombination protein N)
MLSYLHVKNFGIISCGKVEPVNGLTVITGETGAGKTLLVEALNFLTSKAKTPGYRVRSGEDEALVEAVFETKENQITLSRVLKSDGRSRCYLNGKLVPLSELSSVGTNLLEINAQDLSQKLSSTEFQTHLVDRYGQIDDSNLRNALKQLKALQERKNKISDADVIKNELARMQYEIKRINQAEINDVDEMIKLKERENEIIEILSDFESSLELNQKLSTAQELINDVAKSLVKKAKMLNTADQLNNILIELKELSEAFSQTIKDPQQLHKHLEEIQDRKALLSDLIRRFGGSLEAVINYKRDKEKEISELESMLLNASELEKAISQKQDEIVLLQNEIIKKRSLAASKMQDTILKVLRTLGLPQSLFEIRINSGCEFYFTASKKMPLQKLGSVASGGELSRVMLAVVLSYPLKDVLVFDEIDRGIGGSTALKLAELLKSVSKNAQVIVITHLAQIASAADMHICVEKEADEVSLKVLQKNTDKVRELARMLSGKQDSLTAQSHASELLELFQNKAFTDD